MKHKLLVIALCCLSLSSLAQSGIYISPLVDETGLDSGHVSYLESKLQSVISTNGYSDFDGITRFVLATKVIETHKDITPTTPSRTSVELEVYLKAGDIVDNKVYGGTTLTLRGIGKSEQSAYTDAFKKIKPGNVEIQTLLNSFKDFVTDYYTHHCDEIICKAQSTAQLGNYDEALFQLVSVPNVCQSCSDDCSAQATTIYQQKIDAEGEHLLRQATLKWQTSKDKATAIAVADLLLHIAPRSSAYPKSQQLQGEIEQKLDSDALKEWQMKMKEYEDKQQFKMGILDAVRAIGVAWGEHQPQSITKTIVRLWF